MFCKNCGKEIEPGAKFCKECGAPFEAPAQPQAWPEIIPEGKPKKSGRYEMASIWNKLKSIIAQEIPNGASPEPDGQASEPASAPRQSADKPAIRTEKHKVAGISFRTDAVIQLARENPDFNLTKKQLVSRRMYDTPVYKYTFPEPLVTLELEPDNPADPNAVKVSFNGLHIGYIKAGSCSRVRRQMLENKIICVTGELHGGPSKILETDDPEDYSTAKLVNDKEMIFGASVKITAHNT